MNHACRGDYRPGSAICWVDLLNLYSVLRLCANPKKRPSLFSPGKKPWVSLDRFSGIFNGYPRFTCLSLTRNKKWFLTRSIDSIICSNYVR